MSKTDKILFVSFKHQYDNFIKFHIDFLKNKNEFVEYLILDDVENSQFYSNKIHRRSLKKILQEIIIVNKIINTFKPNKIITITPKIGFIFSLTRLITLKLNFKQFHWFTGQVWSNKSGIRFWGPKIADFFTFLFSSKILCDSTSQKQYLINEGFILKEIYVIGNGSICGVDDILFDIPHPDFTKQILTIGIVGRISVDKGSFWLINFLNSNKFIFDSFKFVFIGSLDDTEQNNLLFNKSIKDFGNNVEYLNELSDLNLIYCSFDILLLPSFREGFSNVIIEAQAASRLVISRNIYGTKSSLLDGETGFFFQNNDDLLIIFDKIYTNRILFEKMSFSARRFAINNFKREELLKKITDFYINN